MPCCLVKSVRCKVESVKAGILIKRTFGGLVKCPFVATHLFRYHPVTTSLPLSRWLNTVWHFLGIYIPVDTMRWYCLYC